MAGFDNDFAVLRHNTDGSLDASFGGDGIVTTDFGAGAGSGAEAYDVLIQPDGRIVAAGHAGLGSGSFNFALARYDSDGSLDPSFGSGGIVSVDLSGGDDLGRGLALQSEGKPFVIGSGGNADLMLARDLPDGTLDTGFGGSGKVEIDFFGAADAGNRCGAGSAVRATRT